MTIIIEKICVNGKIGLKILDLSNKSQNENIQLLIFFGLIWDELFDILCLDCGIAFKNENMQLS